MHKLSPQTVKSYSNLLTKAVEKKDWKQVQELDLKLRPVLKLYRTMPKTAALNHELKVLERSHNHAFDALEKAKKQLEQTLNSFGQEAERAMAYQQVGE